MKILKFAFITIFIILLSISIFGDELILWEDYKNINENQNKYSLIFFYTDWCSYCTKMKNEVFTKEEIAKSMNDNFISVKLNPENDGIVDEINKKSAKDLASQYGVSGYPTIVFLDSKGNFITKLPGYAPADVFEIILKYIHTGSYEDTDWKTYYNKNK